MCRPDGMMPGMILLLVYCVGDGPHDRGGGGTFLNHHREHISMTSSETVAGGTRRHLLILSVIAVLTLAVFLPVAGHDFLNYDDNEYVTENPAVLGGLTAKSAGWAFTRSHAGNWHPLTWISHMIDVELFGMKAGGHHLVSLILHLACAFLLYFSLWLMTGAFWRSGAVAALFAVHPLHVESVAWIAERKDVLSAFFWMLAMLAYLRYLKRPGAARYLLLLVLFAMGLMSKAMLVTFPFVLLLLDFWPLGRWNTGEVGGGHLQFQTVSAGGLFLEKVPLMALAAVSAVVTYAVQAGGGGVMKFEEFPHPVRAANAALAYAGYIWKTLFPGNLAVIYPHPGEDISYGTAAAAALVLTAVTVAVIRSGRRHRFLVTGWFWYLGTLVPVIGLVQVGWQSMADRYTYLPVIGLFIIATWGAAETAGRWRHGPALAASVAVPVVIILAGMSHLQVGYWRDSVSLFYRAVSVTGDNFVAYHNLGNALVREGRNLEAIEYYRRAVEIKPDVPEIHTALGNSLAREGKYAEAISHYQETLKIDPGYAWGYYNMGVAFFQQGRYREAAEYFSRALVIEPGFSQAGRMLGKARSRAR